jgi:hypothetical protein
MHRRLGCAGFTARSGRLLWQTPQRQIGRPRLMSLPLVNAPPRAPAPPPIAAPTNGLPPAIAAMAAQPPAPNNPPDKARSPRL